MKLYHSPTSPYVRKVMVLLHETDQLQDVELQTVASTPVSPAEPLISKAPLTKVPALERPDGPTLFDSRVICAFLDARAQAGLYPDGPGRWPVSRRAGALGCADVGGAGRWHSGCRPADDL